jgi:hypothetical protein
VQDTENRRGERDTSLCPHGAYSQVGGRKTFKIKLSQTWWCPPTCMYIYICRDRYRYTDIDIDIDTDIDIDKKERESISHVAKIEI